MTKEIIEDESIKSDDDEVLSIGKSGSSENTSDNAIKQNNSIISKLNVSVKDLVSKIEDNERKKLSISSEDLDKKVKLNPNASPENPNLPIVKTSSPKDPSKTENIKLEFEEFEII